MADERIDTFYKNYFRNKFLEFGDTPKGVDWKDHEAQYVSFDYIMTTIRSFYPNLESFSIRELGCGYGAFLEYLTVINGKAHIEYFGVDLVNEMIQKAKMTYPEIADHFFAGDFKDFKFEKTVDFIISSGVFNLRGDYNDEQFAAHILHTVELMFEQSRLGIVLNMMTPAPDFKDPKLFYPSLDIFFNFIYKKLSRKVTITTSYPLWEITIGVFK